MLFDSGSCTCRDQVNNLPAIYRTLHRAALGNMGAVSLLFDLASDPAQDRPLDLRDPAARAVERRMIAATEQLMRDNDAPAEQWERLGLA